MGWRWYRLGKDEPEGFFATDLEQLKSWTDTLGAFYRRRFELQAHRSAPPSGEMLADLVKLLHGRGRQNRPGVTLGSLT